MGKLMFNGIDYTGGGGGGGATQLSQLGDVNFNNPQEGQIIKYDSNTSKWVNVSGYRTIYSSFNQPSVEVGNEGDIYLLLSTLTSSETIIIYYDHEYDGVTTTVRIEENGTEIYANTVDNVQQGDLSRVYAGFDEVTANVISLNGISFIFKYRGVAVNSNNPTCFFTSFNNGTETAWTMQGASNSSYASHVSKEFNVPTGNIISGIFLKNNNMWIPYTPPLGST